MLLLLEDLHRLHDGLPPLSASQKLTEHLHVYCRLAHGGSTHAEQLSIQAGSAAAAVGSRTTAVDSSNLRSLPRHCHHVPPMLGFECSRDRRARQHSHSNQVHWRSNFAAVQQSNTAEDGTGFLASCEPDLDLFTPKQEQQADSQGTFALADGAIELKRLGARANAGHVVSEPEASRWHSASRCQADRLGRAANLSPQEDILKMWLLELGIQVCVGQFEFIIDLDFLPHPLGHQRPVCVWVTYTPHERHTTSLIDSFAWHKYCASWWGVNKRVHDLPNPCCIAGGCRRATGHCMSRWDTACLSAAASRKMHAFWGFHVSM